MDNLKAIEKLELSHPRPYDGPEETEPQGSVSGDTAVVDAGAMLVFDADLSSQAISDISDSMLFSQLAASAKYCRFAAPDDWRSFYLDVMQQIGWVQSSFQTDDLGIVPAPVSWSDIVVRLMQFGSALAASGIKAAQALSQTSKPMRIWNDNALAGGNGLMIMGASQVSNGDISAAITMTQFEFQRKEDRFLRWNEAYRVTTYGSTMVLNEEVYAKVRQAIIDKLGDRTRYCIANVPM